MVQHNFCLSERLHHPSVMVPSKLSGINIVFLVCSCFLVHQDCKENEVSTRSYNWYRCFSGAWLNLNVDEDPTKSTRSYNWYWCSYGAWLYGTSPVLKTLGNRFLADGYWLLTSSCMQCCPSTIDCLFCVIPSRRRTLKYCKLHHFFLFLLLLLSGDIEPNPGPDDETVSDTTKSSSSSLANSTRTDLPPSDLVTLPGSISLSADSQFLFQQMSKFNGQLSSFIAKVERSLLSEIAELRESNDNHLAITQSHAQKIQILEEKVHSVEEKLASSEAAQNDLEKRVHFLEKEQYKNCFIVLGAGESNNENDLRRNITSLIPELNGITFSAERLGKKRMVQQSSAHQQRPRAVKITIHNMEQVPAVFDVIRNTKQGLASQNIKLKKMDPPHIREMNAALWTKINDLKIEKNDEMRNVFPVGNKFVCRYGTYIYKSNIKSVVVEQAQINPQPAVSNPQNTSNKPTSSATGTNSSSNSTSSNSNTYDMRKRK